MRGSLVTAAAPACTGSSHSQQAERKGTPLTFSDTSCVYLGCYRDSAGGRQGAGECLCVCLTVFFSVFMSYGLAITLTVLSLSSPPHWARILKGNHVACAYKNPIFGNIEVSPCDSFSGFIWNTRGIVDVQKGVKSKDNLGLWHLSI